ncbi:MAG: hypothetical protein V3R78_11895, partial [Thermodesulfobacteriota bacterium]
MLCTLAIIAGQSNLMGSQCGIALSLVLLAGKLNPDFAVDVVARRRKPQRNEQLERFCDEGIFINMLRSKIVKQA